MAFRYYTGVTDTITNGRSASRARITLLWFGFLIAVITYLDRVCISAAAPYITDELHLTTAQMARVLSAFALSYSLFEIPSGWLSAFIGPGKVLCMLVAF